MGKAEYLRNLLHDFCQEEDGAVTISYVMMFPVFMLFFLMTYENGMISLRHVMLEHGIDRAVRDLRLGNIDLPTTRDVVRARICGYSLIVPDCANQLELEMVPNSLRDWVPFPAEVKCVDRGNPGVPPPGLAYSTGSNNELVIIRACARFDPILPTTGIGRAIRTAAAGDTTAAGSYALVSTAAYVVEPFNAGE